METEKDLLMFYHTSLRNVGLYTSVSLALLGYSRFYRGKSKIYNIVFILLSLAILLCAIAICKYLIADLTYMRENVETDYLDKWIVIPRYILLVNTAVGLFGLATLLRETKMI